MKQFEIFSNKKVCKENYFSHTLQNVKIKKHLVVLVDLFVLMQIQNVWVEFALKFTIKVGKGITWFSYKHNSKMTGILQLEVDH